MAVAEWEAEENATHRECPECGKAITTNNLARHLRNVHGSERSVQMADEERAEEASPFTEVLDIEPVAPKRKLFGMFGGKSATPPPPKPMKEKRPKRSLGKRKPAADLLGTPFTLGAQVAAGLGFTGTATMLQIQAPYSGHVLDEAISGTFVDRLAVQPIAKAEDRLGMVGSVVLPPVLVFQMETHPERIPILATMLKESLRWSAPYIAEGIKKKRVADEKMAEVMAELYPDAPEGTDPLDAMVMEIVSKLNVRTQPQEGPEPEPEDSNVQPIH